MPFKLHQPYPPRGDQPQAIDELAAGLERGDRHQTLLGVTGSGKTFTIANVIARWNRPTLVISHNKTLAAQLYGEFRQFFPDERGRLLHLVLRLLPARGVRALDQHVHRQGRQHQRRHRPPAPAGHLDAARARRRHHRGERVVHLRPRYARGLEGHAHRRTRGGEAHAPRIDRAAGGDPVLAQRPRGGPRPLPRARQRGRGAPGLRRRDRAPRAGRRRGDAHLGGGSGDRQDDPPHGPAGAVSGQALRDARAAAPGCARHHSRRAGSAARRAALAEQAARGPAAAAAHRVRPRDAGLDRHLPGRRELFAAPFGPRARRAPRLPDRLFSDAARRRAVGWRGAALRRRGGPGAVERAAGFPHRDRRVARHGVADRRHVRGRSLAQADAGRIRLPPALGARQSPAAPLRNSRSRPARRSTSPRRPASTN